MAGIVGKDRKILLDSLEEQGAQLKQVTKGVLVRYPDGSTDVLHRSQSDWRGTLNFRSGVLRAGLEWPFDDNTKKRAKPPTEEQEFDTPQEDRMTQKEKLALTTGYLEGRSSVRVTEIATATGLAPSTVVRHLRGQGWRKDPSNPRNEWVTPEPVSAPEPQSSEQQQEEVEEVATQPTATIIEAPEPVATDHEREFIDTHDSWTIDIDTMPVKNIDKLAAIMAAAGLEMEIRVWQKRS